MDDERQAQVNFCQPSIFWSNCLLVAFKQKIMHWKSVRILPILRGCLHFHVMWLDRRDGKIRHFTHKSIPGWHCDLFFKGRVEEVCPNGLKKWLKNNKAIAPEI